MDLQTYLKKKNNLNFLNKKKINYLTNKQIAKLQTKVDLV